MFFCSVLFGLAEFEVDEAEEAGGHDDPRELIPVEEGEPEERWGGAIVEGGEAEAEVGQGQGHKPEAALFARGGGGGGIHLFKDSASLL